MCGDQASAFTAAPWPWSSWAPAPSFDADQTRTALSLPPVRTSISESGALGKNATVLTESSSETHTATPSTRRRIDGVENMIQPLWRK